MAQMSEALDGTGTRISASEDRVRIISGQAKSGKDVMIRLSSTMAEVQGIDLRMRKFTEIISQIAEKIEFINDIVFKTQILSFNASIEAARAGVHGRGFSIVAEEVGKLASESGSAASAIAEFLDATEVEVGKLVSDTSATLGHSNAVVAEAMANFTDIAKEIEAMTMDMSQIRHASLEQAQGVVQTKEAVIELQHTATVQGSLAQQSAVISDVLLKEVATLLTVLDATKKVVLGSNTSNREVSDLDQSQPKKPAKEQSSAGTKAAA
jgi:methyl-accepting chemotaxis protein